MEFKITRFDCTFNVVQWINAIFIKDSDYIKSVLESPQTHTVYIQYIYCVQTVHLLYSYIRVPFLPSSCWWHERCPSFLGPWPHKEYPGEGEGAPQRSCLPHQVYLASWVCAHLPKHPDLWVQLSHWPKSRIKTYLNKEWLQKVILST